MASIVDIIRFARVESIANALDSSEEAYWRSICRSYSKTFHTPLHVVLELPPENVALAYFENQLDDLDAEKEIDNLMDIVYGIEDPEYESGKREELKDFMKEAEKEEVARLKANKPIHPGLKAEDEVTLKNTSQTTLHEAADRPTGGSINLSYLEGQDSEE